MSAPRELPAVAARLGDLRERVVFVGGMIRALLITDPAVIGARPTADVDAIIDVGNYAAYAALGKEMRALGFREANEEGAPICRWIVDDIRFDMMPIDPAILGFSNIWYPGGIENAVRVEVDGVALRIIDAVHFCATKIEAFAGRGDGDFYHHDLEDLIAVVDGRSTIVDEVSSCDEDLRTFLAEEVASLLAKPDFVEAIPGHLAPDEASQARAQIVLDRLRAIAALRVLATQPLAPTLPTNERRRSRALPSGQAVMAPVPASVGVLLGSSNLHSAAYDAASQTLTIRFRSGGTYEYSGVPSTIYAGLLAAGSHGRYHHRWIKDRYPYRRVR